MVICNGSKLLMVVYIYTYENIKILRNMSKEMENNMQFFHQKVGPMMLLLNFCHQ